MVPFICAAENFFAEFALDTTVARAGVVGRVLVERGRGGELTLLLPVEVIYYPSDAADT